MSTGAIDALDHAIAGGAPLDVVLDLVDDAIEHAVAGADGQALARLASSLDETASTRGPEWGGLSIAAARARALASRVGVPGASDEARTAASAESPVERPAPERAVVPPPRPASSWRDATAGDARGYAGWWRRTAAFAIDWLALGVGYALLGGMAGDSDSSVVWIAELALPVAYFAGMHAYAGGATLGKAMLGMAVRVSDGHPIGLGRASGRAIATFALWITLIGGLVDLVVGAADSRRQWLHDKIAGTVVVLTRR